MRINILFLLTVSIILLAGCDNEKSDKSMGQNSAASQSNGQELAACDLLTPADIEAATGEAMEAGEHRGYECKFKSIARNEYDVPRISIRVRLEFSRQTPQEQLKLYNANMTKGMGEEFKPAPIKGVGDDAYWDDKYGVIMASKSVGGSRSAFVLIQPIDVAKEKSFEIAKSLAIKAFEKL
jgi:hypothetical protein